MKNNKGISLTEVLVTCCIVAIMGSIAVVNFGSHRDPVEKNQLFQSAKLWSAKVETCLLNVGGWIIERPAGLSNKPPCKVGGDSNFASKFKTRLGWDCPVENPQEDNTKAGPGCFPHFSNNFYCLAIQKEVKGKKYQCVVHFNIEKRKDKIYCGTPASYESVDCGDSPSYTDLNEANQNKWPDGSEETDSDDETSTPNNGQGDQKNMGNTQNRESEHKDSDAQDGNKVTRETTT